MDITQNGLIVLAAQVSTNPANIPEFDETLDALEKLSGEALLKVLRPEAYFTIQTFLGCFDPSPCRDRLLAALEKHRDEFWVTYMVEKEDRIGPLIPDGASGGLSKVHVTYGVYPNASWKRNVVAKRDLESHIEYNQTMRPGRALIVDGVVRYAGSVQKDVLDDFLRKIPEIDAQHPSRKPTIPYR